jgi:hypothetical protein
VAKLEIKKREGTKGLTLRDCDILIDGHEPSGLVEFKLNMGVESFNEATITFAVDGLEIDAEALAMLQAEYDKKQPEVRVDNFGYPDVKEVADEIQK